MSQKVLVVEDDLTLMETLEYNLARQGYEVLTAADGLKALETARQERPDMIVLDIMLPGLDGLEVCRILRRDMAALFYLLLWFARHVSYLWRCGESTNRWAVAMHHIRHKKQSAWWSSRNLLVRHRSPQAAAGSLLGRCG